MNQKNTLPTIEVDHVSKSYVSAKKKVEALDDISLTIHEKEIYGIIGSSGAGKSTLIRCLAGLIRPTTGRILFEGESISEMDKVKLRHFHGKVGMIFQHFNLLSSRTAAENICYPLEIHHVPKKEQRRRVEELLELVGLQERGDNYPSQLSGGEKQRVGIARALANHPKLLLCDEGTSALDPKTTRDILKLLQNLHHKLGITIALITHEMDVVKQICDKVAVMDHGVIIEEGQVSEVFANPKHIVTRNFLKTASHEIPLEFLTSPSPNRQLLRLRFKGDAAGAPIISEIVRRCNIQANILLGWIDRLQTISIGTLVVEFSGSSEGIAAALQYLSSHFVHYEEVHDESR